MKKIDELMYLVKNQAEQRHSCNPFVIAPAQTMLGAPQYNLFADGGIVWHF